MFSARLGREMSKLILALSGLVTTVYVAAPAWGAVPAAVVRAPEIDPASAVGALTLLLGCVAVLRGRAKQ
jgi:hypothetical protein